MTGTTIFSLQGWDTANATSFDVVNQSIVAQKRVPQSFLQQGSGNTADLQVGGKWGSWSLVQGAGGGELRMDCAIAAGEAFTEGKGAYQFAVATAGSVDISNDGARQDLKVAAKPGKQPTDPALNAAFGILGRRAGTFYFEIKLTAAAAAGTAPNAAMISIATLDEDKDNFGAKGASWSYAQDGGFYFGGKQTSVNDASCAWNKAGAVVGVAVDLGSGEVWFRKPGGGWIGANADPAKGTGAAFVIASAKPFFPAVALGAGVELVANFGEAAFANPAPAGFGTWAAGTLVTLDGVVAETQISLAQVAASGNSVNLLPNASGTTLAPAVVVQKLANATGTMLEVEARRILVEQWFNAHIADFDNVFHTVDIDTGLSATAPFAWLKPTLYDYAAAPIPASTPPQSVFAILAMTENRTGGGTLARQVDPTIMDGMPTDANSVVVISAERFTAKVLLNSVNGMFPGSKVADFALDTTGLIVTNANDVNWHAITLADKTTVTPVVPAGGFKMRVDGATIVIEFVGMTFPNKSWSLPGTQSVKIDMTQHLFLTFNKAQLSPPPGQKSKHVLSVSFADPAKPGSSDLPKLAGLTISTVLDATATKAQQDASRENQVAVIASAVMLGVGFLGAVGSGIGWCLGRGSAAAGDLAAAAAQGDNDVQLGDQALAEVDPNHIYGSAPPPANEYSPMPGAPALADSAGNLSVAGQDFVAAQNDVAVDAVAQNTGQYGPIVLPAQQAVVRGVTCLSLAKAGLVLSVMDMVASGPALGVHLAKQGGIDMVKQFASGDFSNLSDDFTVENLLDNLLAAYDWPQTSTWELRDARLRDGALVLYGKLS